MTKIFKAIGIEFTKPLKWYNWLTLAWVAVSFILLSIDTETAPIWAVFLVVANFALSIKVAAKTIPDIKDDEKKRIIDLTLGELMDAIDERIEVAAQKPEKPKAAKRYVYGLKGLAILLGCSKTTAARLKASGRIDAAITQVGALLIIDADLALKLAAGNKKK